VTLPAGKFKGLDAALADRCDLQVAIFGRNGYGKPLIGRKAGFGHLRSIWRGVGRVALISINRIARLRLRGAESHPRAYQDVWPHYALVEH
jgi:hypothetical protein